MSNLVGMEHGCIVWDHQLTDDSELSYAFAIDEEQIDRW